MSKLNAIKFKVNWRVLLALVVVAWLVNTAAGVIAESVELSAWARALVLVVANVSYAAFAVLALVGIGAGALAVVKFVGDLFPSLFSIDRAEEPEVIEAGEVTDALDELGRRLDEIESNRDEAIARLQDADMLASTLVGLIRRTVAKAKTLTVECERLEAALGALVSGDTIQIAKVAGALNDQHIRDLMLDTNGDDNYRASVIQLAATQTGALRSQSEALRELSIVWIENLSRQRAQTARLGVVIDALDAARPIASIDANLREAQRFLMLSGNPEAHQVTRSLPSGAVRPMLEGHK